jgi:NADH-quinone oxidoreductase subunit E
MISAEGLKEIDRCVAKYPPEQKQSAVMAALAVAQEEHGWLSPELMVFVADYLSMPPVAVQEVATFYTMYELKPVGKHKITLCTNLPCQLGPDGGSDSAAQYLKQKLGIDFGETTPDGKFTLKEGECFGSCGDAPVLLVNNHRMCSFMSREKIDQLIEELSK